MFARLLEQVVSSDQTRRNIITDGLLEVTYADLQPILKSIGDYFLSHEIDVQHPLALECPNSVPSALTVLALMERGIGFALLPQQQENQPDLKPVPRFCKYRVAVNMPCHLSEDWARHPARFLTVERNAQFQTLPGGVDHGLGQVYLRTSGSMGTSKIVVHSHDNFVGNAHNCVKKFDLEANDRVVIPIPLAHIYGMACAFLPAFASGASIDLQSNTNHVQYLAREKTFKPNIAFLTPTLCGILLDGGATTRTYKVIATSGQRIGDDLYRRFDRQVGGTLINVYGSSELGTIAACEPDDLLDTKITSIGQPLQTAKLRIHQPDPTTGSGELQCRNDYSFAGYVDESGNWLHRAAKDEWFDTGDLATVTDTGEIRLVGRAKNSINRSGYLVLFSDIERILETMDDISRAVVIASADENERGQALVAFCVPAPNASLNSQQVRKDCFDKLPVYAIPDEVRIMASLPLLPSGKVDQQALQKQAQALIQQPTRRRPRQQISAVEDVMETLRWWIAEDLDVNISPAEIDPDMALLIEGLSLDSIAVVRLITLIKDDFNLEFHDDALDMDALQSVRTLSEWIYQQLQPQEALRKAPDKRAPDKRAPDSKAPDSKAPDSKAPDSKAKEENRIGHYVQHLRANVSLLHMRAAAFGINYYVLQEANQKAHDPASWSAALLRFAESYESAAQEASATQRMQSARQWWQMTVNHYHFAQMFLEGEERKQYQTKCWQAYERLAALVEPCCQRVAIPYQDMILPGYLRVAAAGAPCVILLGGFEFSKESELHQWGEYFLDRGISVLGFDGPGQGEVAEQSTMRCDVETVIAAAIDFLERQMEPVDASRIGLFGVSLGGYMAIRSAAMEDRVTACISLSGPFDGSTTRNLAPRNQKITARLFGFDDAEQLSDPDGPINLGALPRATKQPLLLIHGTLDHIVPTEQVARIQAWAEGATELWTLEDVEHCCFSRASEVVPAAADWMATQLSTASNNSAFPDYKGILNQVSEEILLGEK